MGKLSITCITFKARVKFHLRQSKLKFYVMIRVTSWKWEMVEYGVPRTDLPLNQPLSWQKIDRMNFF